MLVPQMNGSIQMLKPTPLTILMLLVVLLSQVVFLSSTSTTFSIADNAPSQTVRSFALGLPVQSITSNGQTNYHIRWIVFALNLAVSYAFASVSATGIARATRLRRPATAYGLVAVAMIVVAFLAAIGISKAYWGYFMAKPGLLYEFADIEKVRAVVPFKVADATGQRTIVVDDSYSLSNRIAFGTKYPDDCLDERILLELERRNLLPPALTLTRSGLPELYPMIHDSDVLANSSQGYDSLARLRGVLVDAIDKLGNRLVFLGLAGGQVSNDHYPYYELLFREQPSSSRLEFVRGQRFFYDAAGMEGFDWYVIWPLLIIPSILVGFVAFTIIKIIRKPELKNAL